MIIEVAAKRFSKNYWSFSLPWTNWNPRCL